MSISRCESVNLSYRVIKVSLIVHATLLTAHSMYSEMQFYVRPIKYTAERSTN